MLNVPAIRPIVILIVRGREERDDKPHAGVHSLSKSPLGEDFGLRCENWLCVDSQSNARVTFLGCPPGMVNEGLAKPLVFPLVPTDHR